jgi:hypothetical protein
MLSDKQRIWEKSRVCGEGEDGESNAERCIQQLGGRLIVKGGVYRKEVDEC